MRAEVVGRVSEARSVGACPELPTERYRPTPPNTVARSRLHCTRRAALFRVRKSPRWRAVPIAPFPSAAHGIRDQRAGAARHACGTALAGLCAWLVGTPPALSAAAGGRPLTCDDSCWLERRGGRRPARLAAGCLCRHGMPHLCATAAPAHARGPPPIPHARLPGVRSPWSTLSPPWPWPPWPWPQAPRARPMRTLWRLRPRQPPRPRLSSHPRPPLSLSHRTLSCPTLNHPPPLRARCARPLLRYGRRPAPRRSGGPPPRRRRTCFAARWTLISSSSGANCRRRAGGGGGRVGWGGVGPRSQREPGPCDGRPSDPCPPRHLPSHHHPHPIPPRPAGS